MALPRHAPTENRTSGPRKAVTRRKHTEPAPAISLRPQLWRQSEPFSVVFSESARLPGNGYFTSGRKQEIAPAEYFPCRVEADGHSEPIYKRNQKRGIGVTVKFGTEIRCAGKQIPPIGPNKGQCSA